MHTSLAFWSWDSACLAADEVSDNDSKVEIQLWDYKFRNHLLVSHKAHTRLSLSAFLSLSTSVWQVYILRTPAKYCCDLQHKHTQHHVHTQRHVMTHNTLCTHKTLCTHNAMCTHEGWGTQHTQHLVHTELACQQCFFLTATWSGLFTCTCACLCLHRHYPCCFQAQLQFPDAACTWLPCLQLACIYAKIRFRTWATASSLGRQYSADKLTSCCHASKAAQLWAVVSESTSGGSMQNPMSLYCTV